MNAAALLQRLDRLGPTRAALLGATVGAGVGGPLLLADTPALRFAGCGALLGVGAALALRQRWVDREVTDQAAHAPGAPPRRDPRDLLDMVWVPSGTFMMGSDESDPDARSNEKPRFEAHVRQPLWVQRVPVTNADYRRFNADHAPGEPGNLPASDVSWLDAVRFCNDASQATGFAPAYEVRGDVIRWLPTDGYRLLTEIEWEYACRAHSQARLSFGDDPSQLGWYGWYDENSGGRKRPVGALRPNAFGLYDLHGNVWEWVWGQPYKYPLDRRTGRVTEMSTRMGSPVLRGGAFDREARDLRAASRDWDEPERRFSFVGFRCARGARPEPSVAP